MTHERSIGLLLQSIPYLSSHRILKVLTPDAGLLTFMARFAASKRASLTTPFLLGEWLYIKDKKELHSLHDANSLEDFAALKRLRPPLCRRPNRPGPSPHPAPRQIRPSPLRARHRLLPQTPPLPAPPPLLTAFRLRLLLVEGLLDLPLPPDEQPLFDQLLFSKSFSHLAALPVVPSLFKKIDSLFENSF